MSNTGSGMKTVLFCFFTISPGLTVCGGQQVRVPQKEQGRLV